MSDQPTADTGSGAFYAYGKVRFHGLWLMTDSGYVGETPEEALDVADDTPENLKAFEYELYEIRKAKPTPRGERKHHEGMASPAARPVQGRLGSAQGRPGHAGQRRR